MTAILPLLVLGIAIVLLYNTLVRRRNAVEEAWSQVAVQLKRRHDLLPGLAEVVDAYFRHERDTLARVVALRERAREAPERGARLAAEAALGEEIGRFMARVEAYPTLRADAPSLHLMEDLRTTENRIAFARQHYNETARRLNDAVGSLPTLLLARPLGFGPADYFELPRGESAVPVVPSRGLRSGASAGSRPREARDDLR